MNGGNVSQQHDGLQAAEHRNKVAKQSRSAGTEYADSFIPDKKTDNGCTQAEIKNGSRCSEVDGHFTDGIQFMYKKEEAQQIQSGKQWIKKLSGGISAGFFTAVL